MFRFRSCLKQANTAASNLVGKLFFNIIQTRYELHPFLRNNKTNWKLNNMRSYTDVLCSNRRKCARKIRGGASVRAANGRRKHTFVILFPTEMTSVMFLMLNLVYVFSTLFKMSIKDIVNGCRWTSDMPVTNSLPSCAHLLSLELTRDSLILECHWFYKIPIFPWSFRRSCLSVPIIVLHECIDIIPLPSSRTHPHCNSVLANFVSTNVRSVHGNVS